MIEGFQQPPAAASPAPAPSSVVAKGIRTAPITAASIICLLIGIGNLILGAVLFGLAAGLGGQTIAPSTPLLMKIILTMGLTFGVGTGLLLIFLAILHFLGWDWLWGARVKGGVLGIISGIIDVSAVFLGIIWLSISILPTMGLSIVAVPFMFPALVVVSIMGIIMLVMIAIGWKTLR
ncbi:MAG: hypothetical protein WHS82_05510 [Candidatus Methanosuratincola sp.]